MSDRPDLPTDVDPTEVLIVMTAFNEAYAIGEIGPACREHGYHLLVVDDGSDDGTAEVAAAAGAYVARHRLNLGQGNTLMTCFRAALRLGYPYVIEMDADGQHDLDDIPRLIEPLAAGRADMVVGSRLLGANHPDAPWVRRKLLPWVTGAINVFTGLRLTDAMCGFRAFRLDTLRRVQPTLGRMLEPEYVAAEMFVRFAPYGLRVEEVPVYLADRAAGKSRKGLVRYGIGVSRALLKSYLYQQIRRGRG